jgi:hypothetical protein
MVSAALTNSRDGSWRAIKIVNDGATTDPDLFGRGAAVGSTGFTPESWQEQSSKDLTMTILSRFAASWQKFLPALSAIGIAAWIALFRNDPTSERALFAALLVIYFIHQIEEHLWPGGFRQFTDAHVFHSGNDNWPVNIDGVALVNTAFVWLPIALAALFPQALRWVGLAWIGLTLINGIIHIVTTLRLRLYNPGLVTSIVVFLPFTIYVLVQEVDRGTLSGADVGLIALLGVLLHLPVAGLFVIPFVLQRRRHLASS